jgi:hypothetical protein
MRYLSPNLTQAKYDALRTTLMGYVHGLIESNPSPLKALRNTFDSDPKTDTRRFVLRARYQQTIC